MFNWEKGLFLFKSNYFSCLWIEERIFGTSVNVVDKIAEKKARTCGI